MIELYFADFDTGAKVLSFETREGYDDDDEYPLNLRAFDSETGTKLVGMDLSRSELRELRDLLNTLDLD